MAWCWCQWEERKGWDVLLRAYLNEFFNTSSTGGDEQPPVLLVLLTNAYHEYGPPTTTPHRPATERERERERGDALAS